MVDNNNNGGKSRFLGVLGSIVCALIITFVIFVTIKTI